MGLACGAGVNLARAADYPVKPLHIIVPFAPGGSTDVLARIISETFNQRLGQPALVENRPGASTIVGTESVARAAPDGYTLLLTSASYTVNPVINKRARYDPTREMQPVYLLVTVPHILAVSAATPIKSVAELVALAKSKPGSLNYASSGIGTSTHLEAEMFKRMAGVDIAHVSYNGAGPAINDVMSGQVQMIFGSLAALMPGVQAGKLRPLGITIKAQLSALPELQPIASMGLPGYVVSDWLGLLAPARIDAATLGRLTDALDKSFADPKFVARLTDLGFTIAALPPAQFLTMLRNDPLAQVARDAAVQLAD